MKKIFCLLSALLVVACAGYGGAGLRPGEDGIADVERVMGRPAMQWENRDGSVQLAYPRGPSGYHTFMVWIAPDGRLQAIRNVLEPATLARIRPGLTQDEVLRLIGPPQPEWTAYFKARDELVWEWRWCDDLGIASRFDVLFDATRGLVRSTMSQRESFVRPAWKLDESCAR